MPPKGKVNTKPKEPEAQPKPAAPQAPPSTINERTQQRFAESRPYDALRAKVGLGGLSAAEQTAWINSRFAHSASARNKLGTKAQRDVWRRANEASLPVRTPKTKCGASGGRHHDWGKDKTGRDVGDYSIERFEARTSQRITLTALGVSSRAFRERRERVRRGFVDPLTGEPTVLCDNEVEEERERRQQMAALRTELYGEKTGSYAQDPEWDDVEPIPLDEPEGALAAIAYPDDYAEAVSYLRAVMLKKENSPRCLRLTEHVISLNPAHYTVWLYRASIIAALELPIPEEITWLNEVALANLKNYQIWHHRHLLIDNYYPTIASSPDEVAKLAKSESAFLATMLAEDTKNYHVWSYRSYLVRKLGMWTADELASIEAMIDDDVRNNSAWSHRFFLVFSDPASSTPDSAATQPDPAVPTALVDREVLYAEDKIRLAPQNQSPWNYLRGVLVKGGRPLASVEGVARRYVRKLGAGEEEEDVKSSYALDLLAEICAEKGERAEAELCLARLAEKWDPVRVGYWEWRRKMLPEQKS